MSGCRRTSVLGRGVRGGGMLGCQSGIIDKYARWEAAISWQDFIPERNLLLNSLGLRTVAAKPYPGKVVYGSRSEKASPRRWVQQLGAKKVLPNIGAKSWRSKLLNSPLHITAMSK